MTANRDLVAPAAKSFGDDGVSPSAVEHDQRGDVGRPLGLLEDVSHAAQVAFALFSHVADEQDGSAVRDDGSVHCARDRKQGDDSRRIVGDARAVELVAIAPHRDLRAGRENRVQVRTQRDVRRFRVAAGADAEHVADLVLMHFGKRQLSEPLLSHSLRGASPQGGAAMDVT